MSPRDARLWLSIEPELAETRLMLTVPLAGTVLRARLPTELAHPGALALLCEALSTWYGEPLCAVLDADASDVQQSPERWARLLGDLDGERVRVEWVGHAASPCRRDRFLGAAGDFRGAKRLIAFAATGQK